MSYEQAMKHSRNHRKDKHYQQCSGYGGDGVSHQMTEREIQELAKNSFHRLLAQAKTATFPIYIREAGAGYYCMVDEKNLFGVKVDSYEALVQFGKDCVQLEDDMITENISKKVLDCSALADTRFAGDFAILSINGKEQSVDDWYYASRRDASGCVVEKEKPFDHVIDPFTGARLPVSDARDLYRGLWITYLENNPELIQYASQFDDVVDSSYSPDKRNKQVAAYNADPFNEEAEFHYKYPETMGGAEIIGAYVLGNRDFYVAAVRSSHWYKNMSREKQIPLAEKILHLLETEDPAFGYAAGLSGQKNREQWLQAISNDLQHSRTSWYTGHLASLASNCPRIQTKVQAILFEIEKKKPALSDQIANASAKANKGIQADIAPAKQEIR